MSDETGPTWKTYIAAAGAVAGLLGVVTLYTPAEGVSWGALLDAGIAQDCKIDLASCPVIASREGLAKLRDAGAIAPTHTSRYVQVQLPMAVCHLDSGTIRVLPDLPLNTTLGSEPMFRFYNLDACSHAPCAKDGCEEDAQFTVVEGPCAQASGVGSCTLLDGGRAGNAILPASKVVGPGCKRMTCTSVPGVPREAFSIRALDDGS